MNINFRRFKALALRTIAGDALKVDVNDQLGTSVRTRYNMSI